MVFGSPEHREYIGTKSATQIPIEEKPRCTTLPSGFSPFGLRASYIEAPYLTYLSKRNITKPTVALYRIGFVDEGGYMGGRIVVPSFDAFGMINFWSARSIYKDTIPSYRLPEASKDIISNEHMTDWSKPVYLVEGIFDEIAIGSQAVALYGKYLAPSLILKLVNSKTPLVYVCLDADARSEAMTMMKKLVGYDIKCALIDLPGKDPGSVGSDVVKTAATSARMVTGSAGLIAARNHL